MIFENISKILTTVINFTNKHKIEIEINMFQLHELYEYSDSQSKNWAKFETNAGTYIFFSEHRKSIEYIGMSKSNTGSRIHNWLYKDEKIIQNMKNDDLILLISFPKENYMAPALESYLIEKYNPSLNKAK